MQSNDPNRMQPSGGGYATPNTLTGIPVAASVPREGFLTASFVWMFVGLLLSAASAWFVMSNPSALQTVIDAWIVLLIAEIALVFVLSLAIAKLPPMAALGIFFVYALLNGLTLGVIVLMYSNPTVDPLTGQIVAGDASGVVSAFLGAAAIFAGAALYGAVTKRDLTSLGGILFMGLIGLLVMSVVQLFFFQTSEVFNLAIGAIGVLIFTGLTAYDVQRIQQGRIAGINKDSASVMGALALYLDFINLFLMLLRLFGNNR